ncbi:sodium/hydrogen exchanger 3 [Striga asiatica]|uniref:Sodium/hydrogen exchanger 3 n=1 Tax=Striga asiatica TaxID=4170 RepID=A0A5A7QES8_STRAF|nr:sodium/hydrogen exchanger 3 [Striga asiatica]
MGAAARTQQLVLKRLHPERNPVHAKTHQIPERHVIKRAGVHLHRDFRIRSHTELGGKRGEDRADEARRYKRGGPTAQKHRAEGLARGGRGLDFPAQGADVAGDSRVISAARVLVGAEGDDGEVAIVAAAAAEGEVDVGGFGGELVEK